MTIDYVNYEFTFLTSSVLLEENIGQLKATQDHGAALH
jgi:hypothetical protein